jgi:ribokinase
MFRVVSVGDISADIVIFSHVYPKVGEDYEVSDFLIDQGGSAANFASAIAGLGVDVSVIGKVGSDWFGRFLVLKLKESGVDVRYVRFDRKVRTGVVFIIVDSYGERTMLSYRGANVRLRPDEIDEGCVKGVELLHVSGYSLIKGTQRDAVMKCIRLAKRNGVLVSFDPGQLVGSIERFVLYDVLKNVDMVMLNVSELKFLSGDVDLMGGVKFLMGMGVRVVGLKLGGRGCLIANGLGVVNVKAFDVKVVNVTGAGDVWDAGFVYSFLNGFSMEYAGRFANAVAALFISNSYKRFPKRDEVEDFLNVHSK